MCVTAFAGVCAARRAKRERDQAENEMGFQKAALSFTDFVGEWGEIEKELHSLVKETDIDRFLILRAWNGTLKPKWTTAVYQYREGSQEPRSYIHFELDDDYAFRLSQIISTGSLVFAVEEIPDSYVRQIYNAEGVKHSAWFFLSRKELETNKDCVAISYCSFATHSDEQLDENTLTRCRILVSRLKSLA